MEQTVYLSSAYLAPVQYYVKLYSAKDAYIERYDHYVKQTYRNRCVIAAADGPLSLTIPTIKSDTPKCFMKDVRISDHGNWRHIHWNALVAAYKHSPFFDYYADDFRRFYEEKFEFLWDFNLELCKLICEQIDIHPHLLGTEDYLPEGSHLETDYRELIHPKKDFKVEDTSFQAKPYYQVFQEKFGFLPNLSIVDLLFNMGPESLIVLRDSLKL